MCIEVNAFVNEQVCFLACVLLCVSEFVYVRVYVCLCGNSQRVH